MCGGAGCGECKGGRFEIGECPKRYVDSDTWALIQAAELYEKGLAPVHGGTLDQTAWFLQAAECVWGERERWLAQKPA